VLRTVRDLTPIVLQHACGYLDLFEEEIKSALASLKRRLMLALVGLISAALALAVGLVWIIAAVWNEPYRLWVIGGICAAFAATAVAAGGMALNDRRRMFAHLKAQWAADKALLPQLEGDQRG
jgi:uncharacterized membrane protein YqjE